MQTIYGALSPISPALWHRMLPDLLFPAGPKTELKHFLPGTVRPGTGFTCKRGGAADGTDGTHRPTRKTAYPHPCLYVH